VMIKLNSNGDLHLSAHHVAQPTIRLLEILGFGRDTFLNNTRCIPSEYHATYRGALPIPNDDLWHQICAVLSDSDSFAGTLEEELISPDDRFAFQYSGDAPSLRSGDISEYSFKLSAVPAGQYKACDIHLSVLLDATSEDALEGLDALGFIAFDKPSADGDRRIFTITCESLDDGYYALALLRKLLPTLGRLSGKCKLEKTTRFLRIPNDAPSLPLITHDEVLKWGVWLQSAQRRHAR
jgi:hypothetical protein